MHCPLLFQRLLIVWTFATFVSASLLAQEEWRSRLYPSNWAAPAREDGLRFVEDAFLQDFSYAGYRMGAAELRIDEGHVFDVVADYGADPSGRRDSTAEIQAAIDAAGDNGGGVVYLPEGSYRLSVPKGKDRCLEISTSDTILRGAGKDRTFLFNKTRKMRNSDVLRIRPSDLGSWTVEQSPPVLLSRDELGPTTSLRLVLGHELEVGDWIVIHNPATVAFVAEINMNEGADGVDWTKSLSNIKGPMYLRQVKGIDPKNETIEIDIPTRWALRTRDGARVYKTATHLSNVALEHFSIGNRRIRRSGWSESDYTVRGTGAYYAHSSSLIEMRGVVNGWIQEVNSYNPGNDNDVHCLSNGVLLDWCRNVTLYRLRFQNAQYGGGGGNGYMIRLNSASESLIAECEVGYCRHGIVMWRMQNSGNVVTRCHDHDSGVQLADTQMETTSGRGSDHHGVFSHSNLFDSNRLERSYLEAAYRGDWGGSPDHGVTSSQCVFWNTNGLEYHSGADFVVHSEQFGQGYVIGTQGAASAIRLSAKRTGSAARTNPEDFFEGIGMGAALAPSSLYLDQLLRRNREVVAELEVEWKADAVRLAWEESPSFSWALERAADLENWQTVDEGAQGDHEETLQAGANFFRLVSQ